MFSSELSPSIISLFPQNPLIKIKTKTPRILLLVLIFTDQKKNITTSFNIYCLLLVLNTFQLTIARPLKPAPE